MKTVRILLLLLLIAAASVAYVVLRPAAHQTAPERSELASLEAQPAALEVAAECTLQTNELTVCSEIPVKEKTLVQPLDERGDAMLFEIEALQNTPFDQAVTMPFD